MSVSNINIRRSFKVAEEYNMPSNYANDFVNLVGEDYRLMEKACKRFNAFPDSPIIGEVIVEDLASGVMS